MLAGEMVVVRLQHEELVDLGSLAQEEAADFLCLGVLLEEVLVLRLLAILRDIAHQELSEEDAGVEPLSDRGIDLLYNNVIDQDFSYHLSL